MIIIELLVGSISMVSMGIIGYYIAKMYEELKGRPRYIFATEINTRDAEQGRKRVRTNAGQKADHEKQDGIQQEKQEEDPDKYQAEEKEDRTKISK